jgi:hypothetical protein
MRLDFLKRGVIFFHRIQIRTKSHQGRDWLLKNKVSGALQTHSYIIKRCVFHDKCCFALISKVSTFRNSMRIEREFGKGLGLSDIGGNLFSVSISEMDYWIILNP